MIPSDKPIILIGMMGCGKTTIGRGLAAALERRFFDSDHEIEKETGKTVAEIFESEGEAAFRSLEKNVVKRLLEARNTVIAAGGGAFAHGRTRALIQENALSIWLKGDAETLFERALKGRKRPLLKSPGARETFLSLLRQRTPYYQLADIHVDNSSASLQNTVGVIIKAVSIKNDS